MNYVLIKKYGIYGAAYATLIAFTFKVILTYYFSSKYYKIHFEFFRIAKIFISLALIYITSNNIRLDEIYLSLFIKSCMTLIFPILLYMLGFYKENEKQKILSFFRLR